MNPFDEMRADKLEECRQAIEQHRLRGLILPPDDPRSVTYQSLAPILPTEDKTSPPATR